MGRSPWGAILLKHEPWLTPSQVWAAALKPDSVLLAPATAAKLAADDAALAAELAGVLLVQHGQRMGTEVGRAALRAAVRPVRGLHSWSFIEWTGRRG